MCFVGGGVVGEEGGNGEWRWQEVEGSSGRGRGEGCLGGGGGPSVSSTLGYQNGGGNNAALRTYNRRRCSMTESGPCRNKPRG